MNKIVTLVNVEYGRNDLVKGELINSPKEGHSRPVHGEGTCVQCKSPHKTLAIEFSKGSFCCDSCKLFGGLVDTSVDGDGRVISVELTW